LFSHTPDTSSLVAAFASSDFSPNDAEWGQAVARERGSDDLSVPEPDEEGNYDSSIFRAVSSAWQQLCAGAIEDEQFLGLLQKGYQRVETMLRVQQNCVSEGIDDSNNPITQALLVGLNEHRDVFDRFSVAVELRDQHLGYEALADLQHATNHVVQTYAWFQRLRTEAMQMQCPSCGTQTRRDARKCPSCGLSLQALPAAQPRLLAVASEGTLKPLPTVTTPNYQRIERALSSWQKQELQDSALHVEISVVVQNMQAHRRANQAERRELADLSEEEQSVLLGLLDAIDEALQMNLDALQTMEQYFRTGESDDLRDGFDRLGPATAQVVQAYVASQTLIGQTQDLEEGDADYLDDEED
jgi:hypothetical protein